MSEQVKIELLKLAIGLANHAAYSPEKKGTNGEIVKTKNYSTPENIKDIYDELISKFKDF